MTGTVRDVRPWPPLAPWAFAGLDDEITGADQRCVAAHHPQPALLHRVHPYQGLTDADLAAVRQWLEHLDDTHWPCIAAVRRHDVRHRWVVRR